MSDDEETYNLDLDVTFDQFLELMNAVGKTHDRLHAGMLAAKARGDDVPTDRHDSIVGLMTELGDSIDDGLMEALEEAEEEAGLDGDEDDGFVEIEFD